VTVGAGFAASASYGQQKIKSDYASVQEQSGIQAGDEGFQINVHGNTDLKGAVIESTQAAIDNDKNTLKTGTLTTSDIQNHAEYEASSMSLGGGYTVAAEASGGSSLPSRPTTSSSPKVASKVRTESL